jgi:CheY-like chemotaxis protein
VLLSDIAMPGQGGFDLIREIRSTGAAFAGIPAAAVTASASKEDCSRALAAGFQMHVAKPVDPLVLANAVARLARAGGAPASASSYSLT